MQGERIKREQVEDWWLMYPDAQLGVLCGDISGITVIDIDTHHDAVRHPTHVDVSVHELFKKFPPTVASLSGSGGVHLFFQYDARVRNSTKLIHPQMDVKNQGGYVIEPPSIHVGTGKPYEWITAPWEAPLAKLPEDVVTWASKDSTGPKVNWKSVAEGVGQGSRNTTGASVAGKLIGAFYEDMEFAYLLFRAWNCLNKPPLPEAELWSVFNNIAKKDFIRKLR